MVVRLRNVAGPEVEADPDGLLGCEVGMAAVGPETGGVEAAVKVGAVVVFGYLGGFFVGLLGGLVVYEEEGLGNWGLGKGLHRETHSIVVDRQLQLS